MSSKKLSGSKVTPDVFFKESGNISKCNESLKLVILKITLVGTKISLVKKVVHPYRF